MKRYCGSSPSSGFAVLAAWASACSFLYAATVVKYSRRGYTTSPVEWFRSTMGWNWAFIVSTHVKYWLWGISLVSSAIILILVWGYYHFNHYDLIFAHLRANIQGLALSCQDLSLEQRTAYQKCQGDL